MFVGISYVVSCLKNSFSNGLSCKTGWKHNEACQATKPLRQLDTQYCISRHNCMPLLQIIFDRQHLNMKTHVMPRPPKRVQYPCI